MLLRFKITNYCVYLSLHQPDRYCEIRQNPTATKSPFHDGVGELLFHETLLCRIPCNSMN